MRATKEYTVELNNRDKGKTFILTEWPATTAERWANRAIIAVGNSGAKIDHVQGMGVNGVAILGFKALFGIQEGVALTLLDELMLCVKKKEEAAPDGRDLVEDDIEEVTTRWRIKQEVFALHTGFSWAEIERILISAITPRPEDSSNTPPTSPEQSASS